MTETKRRKLNINQAQENKVLKKIVHIANSELALNMVLREMVRIVVEATRGDSVFIYLFDDKRKNLILMASKTPHTEELGKIQLKAGEGITGWVASKATPVAIGEKAYQDKRFKGFDLLPEDRYEAFLSVPIFNKRKCVGVINVQHREPHEYTERTIGLIALIAKQTGGVIENSKLMEESLKAKEALETRKLIERAKALLMRSYDLDDITAYNLIHKKSMDTRRSMKEIAESILIVNELQAGSR